MLARITYLCWRTPVLDNIKAIIFLCCFYDLQCVAPFGGGLENQVPPVLATMPSSEITRRAANRSTLSRFRGDCDLHYLYTPTIYSQSYYITRAAHGSVYIWWTR